MDSIPPSEANVTGISVFEEFDWISDIDSVTTSWRAETFSLR